MELNGQQLIPATVDATWSGLNDPETLKACIAGCESIEKTGDDEYAIQMTVKIGPVNARFKGRLMLANLNPPASYTINFEGQGGVAGFGKGMADVRLAEADASTRLDYAARAQIGGKIAQIGSRLVDSAARKIADEFFSRFNARMGGTAVGGAAIDSPPAALAQIDAGPEAGGTGPATEDLDTPKKGWLDRFRKTQ